MRGNKELNQLKFISETKFGVWFLGSETWVKFVLEAAIEDLLNLMGRSRPNNVEVVIDVGCGQGKSFKLLKNAFNPQTLIGIDVVPQILEKARMQAKRDHVQVDLRLANGASTGLPDNSVDILFCHQTFHHLVDHERAIEEFYRIIKPGGLLLFAESMRAYIHSWIIKILFRHPMDVQKNADEYLALIRHAGFQVKPDHISFPYLWWSRPDLGLLNRLHIKKTPSQDNRVETLMNLVAVKLIDDKSKKSREPASTT